MKKIHFLLALAHALCLQHSVLGRSTFDSDSVFTDSVSLEVMIGQMIITGIGDFSYMTGSEEILNQIASGYVGGIILFEKNINKSNPVNQLKRTIDSLQARSTIPLFVAIDEEGGKVNRLKTKYGFPETKQAQYLGELNNLDSTAFYAQNTAGALANLGINLNFAPTVDVNTNPANPVIGKIGRSYSSNPKIVALHAGQVVKTHRSNSVFTVLKHFPGHGSSQSDTHLGIADVSNSWQFKELMPYKDLLDSGLVDAIMTAHIVNRHLDDQMLPATLSTTIIQDILRNVLNYDGVVFSDDMQMHAIAKHYGFEEAIKMSINAGVDVIMFANNVEDHDKRSAAEVHTIITKLVDSGEIPADRIQTSYRRIMKLKKSIIK